MQQNLLLIIFTVIISCNSKNKSPKQLESNKTEIKLKMNNSTKEILNLAESKDVLVIRTDFSDNKIWNKICNLISKSGNEQGFKPYVEYLSDKKFEGLKIESLLNRSKNYEHLFIFLIDSITINNKENPILCIDLYDKPGQYFRTIPSEMWGIENNLSISNIDFEDCLNSTDANGIYRGF